MIGARIVHLMCIGLALNVAAAHADRALRMSTKHLVAESASVTVIHDHDVKHIKTAELLERGEIGLELNSTLRIVRKSDKSEVFNQPVMPLTALTSVDGGRYFAGLSSLRALSFDYNFILISADGKIVTTALITPTSGHCKAFGSATSNTLLWFDESAPEVQLSIANGQVESVAVSNPYDRAADGGMGRCVIRVERDEADK